MKVETRILETAAVVDISGDVDMSTSPRLRRALIDLTDDRQKRIVVNLGSVGFLDSSGIATLVQALKEARPFGGEVRLASPSTNVLRVLKLSNLSALFPIFDSVDEAVAE
jgi:anti-sigma B factor antagonist